MIENWEVKQAFRIGSAEIVLGEDVSNQETPFVVSNCKTYSELGFCEYSNSIGTDDYLEAVEEYTKRITAEAEHVRQERQAFPSVGAQSLLLRKMLGTGSTGGRRKEGKKVSTK